MIWKSNGSLGKRKSCHAAGTAFTVTGSTRLLYWTGCYRGRVRYNMGGYGSGGQNKTHRRLENFHRIDSFSFYGYLKGDKYLSCKETVKYPIISGNIVYYVGEGMAEIREGDSYTDLILSSVPGIGGKSTRLYFHCPYCGKRVRYLYRRQERYLCRDCAKLNYASQQKSGMDEMRLKMEHIVEKKLGYTWWRKDYPDTPIQDLWHIPKPPYMRWEKYERIMQEFRHLQKDYEREFWVGLARCSMLSGREKRV